MCNGFAEGEDDGEEEESTFECYECGSLNLAQTNTDEWDEELKEEIEDSLVSLYSGGYSAEIPTIILLLAAAGKIRPFHYSRKNYKDSFKLVDRKEALERLRKEVIDGRKDVIGGIRRALEHEKIAELVKPAIEKLGADVLDIWCSTNLQPYLHSQTLISETNNFPTFYSNGTKPNNLKSEIKHR